MIVSFVGIQETDRGAILAMTDCRGGARFKGHVLPFALMAATLIIDGGEPAALPLVAPSPFVTPRLMVENDTAAAPTVRDSQPESDAGAPLAELTEALAAARAKLEQLDKAAEALAGAAALRAELATKEEKLAAQEEANRRLIAELETLRARRVEWQRADDAAKAEIAGLGQALDEVTAEAKKLEGELAAVRWQNAQLSTSLNRAREEQDSARAKAETVRTELSARIDDLTASGETSKSEIRRLGEALAQRGEELAAANQAQEQTATRVADLQDMVDGANHELSRVRGELEVTVERLNEVNAALIAAEQERDAAFAELDDERSNTDRLSGQLTLAQADLKKARAVNRQLETRLAGLEQAATVATDAARQNLLAVENRIAALNATLAKVDLDPPAPAKPGEDAGGTPRGGDRSVGVSDGTRTGVSPEEGEADPEAAGLGQAPAAGPAAGELALVKLSDRTSDPASTSLAEFTAELPVESRIQAQSLLADLKAETDPQGVKLIVPGGELFTVNGQEVRGTAHESLAKVAELINLYKSQPVLIIGHTDAVGASDYNKTLSERRASLVRQFFIDHFDVEAARLSTQGMGEQQPIASNATAAGRRANRRVEVLILN
jgi:chemotaxis protein MotB